MLRSYESDCNVSAFTLPTVQFVGGSNQDFRYHVFDHLQSDPYDLEGCTAEYAIVNFYNRYSTPVVKKSMTVIEGDSDINGDETRNVLKVLLSASDTKELEGKYIYQISIKNSTGSVEIPNQGIMFISNNIDKSFVG